VHLIFGNRTIATLPASVTNGRARIVVPPAVHLNGVDNALASATLGGHAPSPRRAPSPVERAIALRLAAERLRATPAQLQVRNLTAIDLGAGIALAGTVSVRGTATPRVDRRLFFIVEPVRGTYALTLANVQTIAVTEPLLEDPAEYLIDALDLDTRKPAIVTRLIGYDAVSYAI
jgi:hypothetical protein